jgi:Cu(I)/Ag(I) efflux system membrane protein CusA/SilA
VGSIEPATVVADRIVAKPYLEIEIDRLAVAQYGFDLQAVQDVIETAIGGQAATTTVEGRERYPVRVRYMRELRDDFEAMERILVSKADGLQVPLGQLARFRHAAGPMAIRSQDSFLVGYVVFDPRRGLTEVDAVADAEAHLQDRLAAGELKLPPGTSYTFTGSYQNHVRAEKRLALILPLTLLLIFLILYFQFGNLSTSALVFSGVAMAWAGGFILIWLYGRPWFLDVSLFGANLRDVFQVHPVNLSMAVWVGFLALFGIATNDGVVMATYLEDNFRGRRLSSVEDIRRATLEAGLKRVRPCLMTTATTILALVPVLTSRGRGADILVPMAIPSVGGMTLVVVTMLIVPVLYCGLKELEAGRASDPSD